MSDFIGPARIPLVLGSASIILSDDQCRIEFPSITFADAEKDVVLERRLNADFDIVHVQVYPAGDDGRRYLGSHEPQRLTIVLPKSTFDDLAKRLQTIKDEPVKVDVDIDASDEVVALAIDGRDIVVDTPPN
jgi:hypothetical protein